MKQYLIILLCVAGWTAPVRGELYIPPLPFRLSSASCVVVGKVVEIEKKTIKSTRVPERPEQLEYLVAVIKVEETLLGDKALTHVRVGYQPPSERDRVRRGAPDLAVGFEGCFLLRPHHKETFFVFDGHFESIVKKGPGFDKSLKDVRLCARVLAQPIKSLEAKDPDERLVAAAILVHRYRSGSGQTEAVPADESKRILTVVRDADWNRMVAGLSPLTVFAHLGLTPKDGWQTPKDFQKMPMLAKEWLTKHAGNYRLQRFAPAK